MPAQQRSNVVYCMRLWYEPGLGRYVIIHRFILYSQVIYACIILWLEGFCGYTYDYTQCTHEFIECIYNSVPVIVEVYTSCNHYYMH